MNEAAETKVCPFCAETIKAAARKCPFCNSRVSRHTRIRQELILGLCFLTVFGSFIYIWALTYPESPGDSIFRGRSFGSHRNDLLVKSLAINSEKRTTNAYYYNVSGFVTNKGVYPWRVKEIELTISNSQGAVDIRHEEVKEPFVIQPGAEHAFVFRYETILTNSIVSTQARVENARDGTLANDDD